MFQRISAARLLTRTTQWSRILCSDNDGSYWLSNVNYISLVQGSSKSLIGKHGQLKKGDLFCSISWANVPAGPRQWKALSSGMPQSTEKRCCTRMVTLVLDSGPLIVVYTTISLKDYGNTDSWALPTPHPEYLTGCAWESAFLTIPGGPEGWPRDPILRTTSLMYSLVIWGLLKRLLFLLRNDEQQRQKGYIREGPKMEKKKKNKKNGRCVLILLLHLDPPYLFYVGRWKRLSISDSSTCLVLLLLRQSSWFPY